MNKIATRPVPSHATTDQVKALRAPVLDGAIIDFYLRRGRQERARAFAQMIRSIFSSPAGRASAEVHPLPVRRRETAPTGCADCADRAA